MRDDIETIEAGIKEADVMILGTKDKLLYHIGIIYASADSHS